MKITVIIPVFNELKTVRAIIDKILNLKDLDIQIILVDDFSTDGSRIWMLYSGFSFSRKKNKTWNCYLVNWNRNVATMEILQNLLQNETSTP